MEKRRTLGQYRAIDLFSFAVMLAIGEFLIVMAGNYWFPEQPFTVSLTAAITCIVYMRWGYYGAIHAVLGGFVFCYFSGAGASQYLYYCVGNLLSVVSCLFLKKMGKEKVRTSGWGLFFPILVLLLMQLGRGLVALISGTPLATLEGFFLTDSLSMVFTFVIIWIARRLDGIYEDQKHYLLRLNAEQKREKEVNYES